MRQRIARARRPTGRVDADTDMIVPSRIVVSRLSGREITKRMTARPRPAKRLRGLMTGDGD